MNQHLPRPCRLAATAGMALTLAALSFLSIPQMRAEEISFHVSPSGDDQNPGTEASPVRTLARARELVRGANQNMTGDITVFLAGGTYRLTEPLVLDERDSGTGGHNVKFAPASKERPIISGGVQVTGWKLSDPARNIWSAPVPAGLKNTRQLYVDGVRAQRARGRLPVKLTETKTGYTASSPAMASWRNPSDIEFVYTGGNALWSERSVGLGGWTEPRCPVAKIDGATITMAQPCWDNSTRRVPLPPGSQFKRPANLVGPSSFGKAPIFVENAYELLGTPGQWYLDRTEGRIYYAPRPGENLADADVEAPVLETLIAGSGTSDKPIHNIIFAGLQFSYATWLFPSTGEGFSEIQANYLVTGPTGYSTQGLCDLVPGGACPFGAWTKTSGNVSFSYDHGVRFLNDVFVHLGGAGLELGHGSQSDLVEGCVFTDISANGIELGGVDLPGASGGQITADNRIANNHIFNVAAEYHGGVGICVGYTQRTKIEHNQIDHQPYTGISLGWGGWPDKIQRAGQANISEEALVADNLIFDHLLLLADGGAIYTQGLTGPSLEKGERLMGNVIHDQFSSGHGIYTDNGCKNVTARGNVIFHTNHDNWGGKHRDYYDGNAGKIFDAFDFEDNYWQQGDRDSSAESVTLKNNHLIGSLDEAPAAILKNAGLQPQYRDLLAEKFTPACAPDSPSRVAVNIAGGVAHVSWSPPCFEGGAPVDSYTVTSSKGDQAVISAADFRARAYAEVPQVTNDTSYTFVVTAHNAFGSSPPSLPSEPVTPATGKISAPSAPQAVSAIVEGSNASIHFQAPASDGGAPVLGYVVTVNPGERKVNFSGRPLLVLGGRHATFGVVDKLETGKAYTFEIAAVNAAGEGAKAQARVLGPLAQQGN